MSKEYNQGIENAVEIVMQSPKLLGIILKNYDKLVKEKNNMSNLELPYWCYGFCCADEGNEKEFLEVLADEKLDTIKSAANATNGKNGGL